MPPLRPGRQIETDLNEDRIDYAGRNLVAWKSPDASCRRFHTERAGALYRGWRRDRTRVRHLRRHARAAGAGKPRRAHPDPARRRRALALCDDPLAESARRAMTRGHRSVHRVLWPVLALIVGLGVTMALLLRPPPEQPE